MKTNINITYGINALHAFQKELTSRQYSSAFVLTDTNTKEHCLDRFLTYCPIEVTAFLSITAGEINKNLDACQKLWESLSEKGADRNSVLINLGGGVVTDLGGFVACTFKRGIDFFNIPTTLLAMVDASIGGKTGIDLGVLKNQIGIIQDPQGVIVESGWLETLPQVELRSGFAEMLKHGLIANEDYWNKLKTLEELTPLTIEVFIKTSIAEKIKVVLEDPYEKRLRKILNFGHTFGHAIESFYLTHPTKKRLLHGEAIAIGMVLESYLATQCSGLDIKIAREIKKTFDVFYPKVYITNEEQTMILNLMRYDKKNKAGRINFVLLKSIGTPEIDVEISQELFTGAFDFYQSA